MQVCVFALVGVIFALHASSEAAKETPSSVSSNSNTLLQSSAPSRVKRRSYDMLRLTRGLHMLRLGKRADGSSPYDPLLDSNQILTLEDEYPESYLYQTSPDDYYKALAALDGQLEPSRLRYRRSTPSDDQMVTPVPALEEGDVMTNDDMKLPGDLEDVYSADYPKWTYAVGDEGEGDETKRKRQLPMLRLGKRENEALKKSLGMLRLGKRQDENLNSDFTDSGEKRSLEMLRLGKKRGLNILRLGKRESEDEKRNINMERLGLDKRHLNMLRLGKRQLNMLRLGKRQLNMLRLGKRQLNMLRLGKRQLNMLRLGKRQLNMLRLGKKSTDTDEKRNLNMLRLGKRSVDEGREKSNQ